MDFSLATVLFLFCLCQNCFADVRKSDLRDLTQQELASKVSVLEQKLAEHVVGPSDRHFENLSEAKHEFKIFEKKYENRIQELEETVKGLTKLVTKQAILIEQSNKRDEIIQNQQKTISELKQQLLNVVRTDTLDEVIADQKKSISILREDVIRNSNDCSIIRDLLVRFEEKEDVKDIGVPASNDQSENQNSIQQRSFSIKKRLLLPVVTTHQPVIISHFIVAFYAYMSASTPSISIQHTLVFDIIKTNYGNGYHNNTGVFIAPETGVYVFTWSMRMYGSSRHSTQLIVNAAEIGIMHLSPDNSNIVGTGIVVAHANAGDDVYVRTHASWNGGNIISDEAGRSSFAGWKLS